MDIHLQLIRGRIYGNYALTHKGYENIKLVSVEKKTASKPRGLEVMISTFANEK